MDIINFLPLISAIILVFLGNRVYYLGKKKELNLVFLLLCLSFSYWAYTNFNMFQADTPETAYFWMKVGALWPFAVSLFNHFANLFSENKKIVANKLTYALIYSPAILFAIVDSTTDLIRVGVSQEYWGFMYVYQLNSVFVYLLAAWVIAVGFWSLFIFAKYSIKSTDKKKKEQAKYVSIGISIIATVGIITEGLLPLLNIQFPVLTTASFGLMGIFVAYAILKYDMFTLSPATAAENIISTMPDSMILTDTDGKILISNQSLTNLLGYTESELFGCSMSILFDDERFGVDVQEKLLHNDILKDYEVILKTKTGEKRIINFSASLVKNKEKTIGIVYIASDITERKRAEILLKNSEEKFRTLAEESPNMISITQNNKIIYTNDASEKSTGYTKEEICSPEFSFMDIIPPESLELMKSKRAKYIEGEYDHEFEHKLITKNGQVIDEFTSIKSIYYNGEPAVLSVSTDITESKNLRKKLEEYSKNLEGLVKEKTAQLEHAQAQLVKSERLAAIGELASMIGHDLRNPLQAIRNSVYYLKKNGTKCPEDKSKEMLKIIDKAINHSNKIINDLLDYSRDIHLELTECRPRALLNGAIQMIQVPDRIKIVNHTDEETWITVDVDKMMRVFINLIKNAIDAMPEKGTLEIISHQTKDNIGIAFTDTGVGIPEEILPKLFSPLFTTKAQGMGFGLAICKRIVESHGGTITVQTAVNKGTTFTITLPLKLKLEIADEKTWINLPESLLSRVKTKVP